MNLVTTQRPTLQTAVMEFRFPHPAGAEFPANQSRARGRSDVIALVASVWTAGPLPAPGPPPEEQARPSRRRRGRRDGSGAPSLLTSQVWRVPAPLIRSAADRTAPTGACLSWLRYQGEAPVLKRLLAILALRSAVQRRAASIVQSRSQYYK